ncbi:AMP-binding protein [Streptomyces sp. NPDC051315]|uniref:class I adenylate-forming enzyme family protein n=1 Tax=Streptomyces sp. NPDC051315 TaxID=3365650 RepID=UPI0037B20670
MNAPAHSTESPPAFLTFPEALERAAARRTTPALWDGGRWRTWQDCLHQAERTAGALWRRGFRAGDVLAAQLPNSWELVVLHAATARLGVLLLPLHSAYGTREAQALIDQSGAIGLAARAVSRGHDRVGEVLTVRERCPSLRHVWLSTTGTPAAGTPTSAPATGTLASAPIAGTPTSAPTADAPPPYVSTALLAPAPTGTPRTPTAGLPDLRELFDEEPGGELPAPPADPRAPLVLLASSGTTSQRPKLCVHSHGGLLGNAAAVARDGGLGAGDTIVSASPLSHAFGLLSVHLALVTGGAVGLFDGWEPRRFAGTLAAAGATAAFAVPAQLRDLLALWADGEDSDVRERPRPALREVRTGGAPVPRELADGVRRTLGARLVVQWGMTEVGAGTYTRPDDPPEAAFTIGRPASGAEVRVLNRDGDPAAPGETGELQYRSPYMFTAYYRAPEQTAAALTPDGWLRSGDLAALDADGAVVYRGRADELINRGGLKFSALEVEELLNDLPQLAQHAVVGRPDPRLGQRGCLLAALREGARLTLDEVTVHLSRKGLATYKLPEQLVLVDRLPTTVTGKIARARLRAIALPPLAPRPDRRPTEPVGEPAR